MSEQIQSLGKLRRELEVRSGELEAELADVKLALESERAASIAKDETVRWVNSLMTMRHEAEQRIQELENDLLGAFLFFFHRLHRQYLHRFQRPKRSDTLSSGERVIART